MPATFDGSRKWREQFIEAEKEAGVVLGDRRIKKASCGVVLQHMGAHGVLLCPPPPKAKFLRFRCCAH